MTIDLNFYFEAVLVTANIYLIYVWLNLIYVRICCSDCTLAVLLDE